KRAVLNDTSSLCIFLERQKANDILLSHMLTYLNDRDWMLRYAFFQSVVDVALCVGGKSLDEYILPLMVQALSGWSNTARFKVSDSYIDTEEAVVAKVLQALTELSDLGLFQKMRIWEFMSAVLGFLYHPNVWIRQAAVSFLASAARKLPRTDVWCILYPSLRYFLRSDVRGLDEQTLLTYIKPSIPRPIFDAVVTWAKNSDKTQFWKAGMTRNRVSGSEAIKESLSNLKKSVTLSLRGSAAKSEEDDQQITRLQNMGMSTAEEAKLLAMRDYITRLVDPRSSRLSSRSEPKSEQELLLTGKDTINLQKLGAMLHTIFIGGATIPGRRPEGSRRSTLTDTPRWTTPSAITSPRIPPVDRRDNPPLEDLRKRLLSMDGSSASIHNIVPLTKDRERRESTNSTQGGSALHLAPMLDKSPPESVTSGGEPSASAIGRRRQRIQLSSDGKAPPL
ncbi:Serine/threonine-protein kinase, partial [Serendipita sp. 399]